MTDQSEERLREAELAAVKAGERIESHERVCAERYQGINDKLESGNRRFDRLEGHLSRQEKLMIILVIVALGGQEAVEILVRFLGG